MTDRTHPDSGRATGGIVEALRARISDLEAQLEAIGAGSISPLIAGAGFDAADMATAAAQGFRDGVASVSAGSEPVATVFTMEALTPGGGVKYHATIHKALPAGTKLYTNPYPKDGMAGWISVDERLPEKNTEVLICFAELSIPSTGQYTASALDHEGWCYPQENHLWPGERPDFEDGGSPTVTHWMPLPAAPGPADGESNG